MQAAKLSHTWRYHLAAANLNSDFSSCLKWLFNFVVVAAVFKRQTARWQCVNLIQPREWQCISHKNADLWGQEFISLLKVFRCNLISVSILTLPTHSSIIQANKRLMFWFSALREPCIVSVHHLYFLRYDTMSVPSSETISVICLLWYIAAAMLWINRICSGMQYQEP